MDTGEPNSIYRVFARTASGGYQLSVWRNTTWGSYAAPDGVTYSALVPNERWSKIRPGTA